MKNIRYTKNLCAFIDILGYKNLVSKAEESDNPLEIINQLEEIIQECIKPYLEFKNGDKEEKYSYEIFSDSIIITTPLESRDNNDEYLDYLYLELYKLILIICGIQSQSLKYNIIFRGSISIGNHYRSENIMFSKALVNAYTSESHQAIYPRVIIDTIYNKELSSEKLLNSLVYSGLALKNKDCIFVDYIGRINSFKSMASSEMYRRFLDQHKKIIETNLELNRENEKVLEKYIWLAEYHNYKLKEEDKDLKINISNSEEIYFEGFMKRNPVIIAQDEDELTFIDVKEMIPGIEYIL